MTLGNTEKFLQGEISLDNIVRSFKASAAYLQQKFLGYIFSDKMSHHIKNNEEEIKEKTILLEKDAEKLAQMVKS